MVFNLPKGYSNILNFSIRLSGGAMYKSFLKKQRGQGMVEYALILVLVAVVVIAALTIMGPNVAFVYQRVGGAIKCPNEYDAWVKAGEPSTGPVYDALNTCWTH